MFIFASFSLYFTLNGFFFSDSTMHKLFLGNGEYNLINQIPIMFYSLLITSIINIIIRELALSERNILEIKQERDINKVKVLSSNIKNHLKLKFAIFFILNFLFLLFFWYYISCFCAVYNNTQIILINDTLISFALSMVYPFFLYLLPGTFRIPSLRSKKKDKECTYRIGCLFAFL